MKVSGNHFKSLLVKQKSVKSMGGRMPISNLQNDYMSISVVVRIPYYGSKGPRLES